MYIFAVETIIAIAMETNEKRKRTSKMDLLTAVENIADMARDSQLSPEFYSKASRYIKLIATMFGLTREQSVMMALFIDQCNDTFISANDIAKVTGCRNTRILRYTNDIDALVEKGLVVRRRGTKDVTYRVPIEVVDAFRANVTFVQKKLTDLTCHQLFDEIADIVDRVDDDEMDVNAAHARLRMLLEDNRHLRFVQKVMWYNWSTFDDDLILLLMFCHLFVNNNDDRIGTHDFEDMFDKHSFRHIKSMLEQGCNDLQRKELVEFCNSDGMGERCFYHLTMKAKRELLDELNLPSLDEKKLTRNMMKSDDIKPRKLYYSSEITRSIDDLAQLLEEVNYRSIHTRLKEQGFRCGFTCLFYGAPGTGKTETALQLARRTGRSIMQVNIAEMKSCWVGESEKNVKALFDTYRQCVSESTLAPILLFNEADAIIGKRQEGAERAVDKMENSLQNIILQEMETLDGILIATTNLAQNMDRAFERRFLYKLRFDKPTVEARAAIWHEMLPTLSDVDAVTLAERYNFSGGQIENIARHYAIDAILHGNTVPTAENLAVHCDNERIAGSSPNRIGFSF